MYAKCTQNATLHLTKAYTWCTLAFMENTQLLPIFSRLASIEITRDADGNRTYTAYFDYAVKSRPITNMPDTLSNKRNEFVTITNKRVQTNSSITHAQYRAYIKRASDNAVDILYEERETFDDTRNGVVWFDNKDTWQNRHKGVS